MIDKFTIDYILEHIYNHIKQEWKVYWSTRAGRDENMLCIGGLIPSPCGVYNDDMSTSIWVDGGNIVIQTTLPLSSSYLEKRVDYTRDQLTPRFFERFDKALKRCHVSGGKIAE